MKRRWTALFALAVAVILAACGGGEGDRAIIELTSTPAATTEPISTPASTATPSADNSPQVIDGVEVLPLTIGDEVGLPDDVALIIEVGCMECHCPCVNGLVRVDRDASGEFRTEDLFAPFDDASIPGYIPGAFAINDDATEIVVGLCSRGYCGPVDPASPDAQTTLYRSVDGGVIWEEVDVLEGAQAVIATTKEGILLNGPHGPEQEAQSGYWLFPSGDAIEPPVEAAGSPLIYGSRLISLPDGEMAWLTNTGDFVRNDGSDFLAFDGFEHVFGVAPDHAGDGLVIEWSGRPEEQLAQAFGARSFLGIVRQDGHLLKAFSSPVGPLVFGDWLTSTQAIGNAYIIPPDAEFSPGFWRPVIFDFESSTIHPIAMPNAAEGFTQPALFRDVLALVQATD